LQLPVKKPIISFKTGIILSTLTLIAYLILQIILSNSPENIKVFGDYSAVFINGLVIIALVFVTRTLKSYGYNTYKVWAIIALAQVFFLIGDILWAYLELGLGQEPFPSIADIFYILYYPLFALAIFMIPRSYNQSHRSYKLPLDIGIIIIVSILFFWTFLIHPTLQTETGDFFSTFVSILYIALDLVLIFVLLDLMFDKIRHIRDWTLILLGAAVTIQIITDIIYSYQNLHGTYFSGGLVDAGWILGYLLLGLAGICEANSKYNEKDLSESPGTQKYTWTFYLPFILVIAAYTLLSVGYQNFSHEDWIILDVGVGVTILMVVAHQIISFRENQELYLQARKEIKKRKEAQKHLKKERDLAQNYFNIARVIMLVLDKKGNVELINDKGCQIIGYHQKEVVGENWFDKFVPLRKQKVARDAFQRIINGEELIHLENDTSLIKNKKDEEKIIVWHNSILKDEKGNITGILSSGEDVTQQKITEKLQKERADRTIRRQSALLKLSRDEVSDLDQLLPRITKEDAHALQVERVSIWFFNNDKSEIVCQNLYNLSKDSYEKGNILKSSKYPHYFQAIQQSHNVAAFDAVNDPQTKEFKESYLDPLGIVSMLDVPIWLRGETRGVLCHEIVGCEKRDWSFEDQDFAASVANIISRYLESNERKRAEKKIKESLHEKEILLQEIHHRVKNNMQVISSLLSLQSRYIDDKESFDVFKESQNRVKSMALIHEKLYESENLDHLDMGSYLESLCSSLKSSYISPKDKINISSSAEDINLNLDTAIPLGLIINELVTNSIKHAFDPGEEGNIKISMQRKGTKIILDVSDDGKGIPDNLDFKNTKSLGLMLVNSLVNQIDGDIYLQNHKGTIFTTKFREI